MLEVVCIVRVVNFVLFVFRSKSWTRPRIPGVSKWRKLKCKSTQLSQYISNLIYSLHCSKDVSLPQQLQRAMAAEAEATREARAKVQ